MNSSFRRSLCLVAASSAIAATALMVPAHADSTGSSFEAPGFAPGPINGQGGWAVSGPYDDAVVSNAGNPAAPASFGAQSLRMSNAVTSGSFGDQLFSPSLVNEAGEPTAENAGLSGGVRQSMFVSQFTFASATGGLQPGLATGISPDRGDGARMSLVKLVDEPTTEFPTGAGLHIVVYDADATAAKTHQPCLQCVDFVAHDLGAFNPAVPHTVTSELRFNPGPSNDVVRVFVDGVLKGTFASWEDYYRYDTESGTSGNSRTVDSLLFRESGPAVTANAGQGFLFDNVSYSSGPQTPYVVTTLKENPQLLGLNPLFLNLNISESATLRAGGVGVAGKTVVFSFGSKTICSGVTNGAGFVQCGGIFPLTQLNLFISNAITASFAGDSTYLPSSDVAGLISLG
ncbi:MAG: exported protein of unknown function [Marmoricola sp.]|nr:exported protein of unknown function [Marmoricola sp.]